MVDNIKESICGQKWKESGEIVENQVPFGWVKLRIEVCAGSDGTNLSIEWSSVKRPKRSNM